MAFKGSDVLDLTDLQRRGLLKKAEAMKPQENVGNDGYFDLGSKQESPQTQSLPQNPFDFLDNASSVSQPSENSAAADSTELLGLKNKIEDLEYKLRVLEDKIAKLGG